MLRLHHFQSDQIFFPSLLRFSARWEWCRPFMSGKFSVVWSASIRSGKLTITYRDDFAEYVRKMRDGEYELILRKKKRDAIGASPKQRKYYWPVIAAMFAVYWTCSPDEAHETLLIEFAESRREPGQPIKVISTSEMNPSEVEIYYEWCREKGRKHCGMNIPLPRQVLADDEEI